MPLKIELNEGKTTTIKDDESTRLCKYWFEALAKGAEAKKDFTNAGRLAQRFYEGNHKAAFERGDDNLVPEGFSASTPYRITTNKTFEMVQIFGPALYFKTPVRTVTSRETGDPGLADIIERYQRYTVNEFAHDVHAKRAIQDALIKGRGVLWSGLDESGHACSKYQNVDHILVDPDARLIDDALWIARLRVIPLWKARELFEDKDGKLQSNLEVGYFDQQTDTSTEVSGSYLNKGDKEDQFMGKTKGMVMYWEIYSKMGMGRRLKLTNDTYDFGKDADETSDFWKICIVPGQNTVQSVKPWPTPHWKDFGPFSWPCSFLDFHPVPGKVWPMSHLQPAFGEQIFLDWAYSFLAQKGATAGRNIILTPEGLKVELQSVIRNDYGADFQIGTVPMTMMEKGIENLIKVIDFTSDAPRMLGEIIDRVEQSFERRTGLSEILYGSTQKQMRSAAEANVKDANARLRIDDMIETVEKWEGHIGRKEAICARFHVGPDKIMEVLGPEAAMRWGQYNQGDTDQIIREYGYSIEAGSARRPNLEFMKEQTALMAQQLLPLYQQTESYVPLNSLIYQWCKAIQIDNPEQFLIPLSMFNGVAIPQMQYAMLQMQAMQAEQAAQAQAMAMQQDVPAGA